MNHMERRGESGRAIGGQGRERAARLAREVAEHLIVNELPVGEAEVRLPGEDQGVTGQLYRDSKGGMVLVAPGFMATVGSDGKLEKVLPF
jgi:hypothetical protein